jgi:nitrate/TMAO reductase-like tetraheme cytochrome c subunit
MENSRRKFRGLVGGLIVVLLLFVGSLVTASELEERDEFCISCHRAPEVTYVERAQTAVTHPATDLASFHYADDSHFRCVDCHRGDQSVAQRAAILWLAAKDTAVHFLGTPDQTIEKGNIPAP